MFPLQPGDELVFGTPTTSQGNQIHEDLIVDDDAFMENNIISFTTSSSSNNNNNRQLSQTTNVVFRRKQRESRDECRIRRVMHRDIERKRRQDMSNLHASLRSLVSLEHNKGKRSVCDQMQEAVNHIKQLPKNIQELRIRSDKLKKLSGRKVEGSNSSDTDNLPNYCVSVNLIMDGVEILISRSVKSSEFGLSRVIAELQERELDVVTCVSTRTNERFLHKIETAACRDMTSFDVSILKDRLTNAIK